MTENDILGFDPTSLFHNEESQSHSQGNSLIYRTRPADTKSEDGHYYSTIKVVYNPFDPKNSILEQQSYSMEDKDGWFSVVSSLTVNDTSCPIFKAWKKCHYAKPNENPTLWKQAAKEEDGGNALFDKRFARYALIQVIEDQNQPDLVGKFMFYKLPKAVYELITTRQNPSPQSGKAPIPVMDYLYGRAIELDVKPGPGKPGDQRYARETSYSATLTEDIVSCINPDGSPLLNTQEQAILNQYVSEMKNVWKEKDPEKRAELKKTIDAEENTQALRKFYNEKIFPEIKSWAPNLIETLGYKEWSDETKKRVQNWIDIVLAGGIPKDQKDEDAPEAIKEVAKETTASTTTSTPQAPTSEPEASGEDEITDDLPF